MIEPKEIIRSNRKSIALVIDCDGQFVVRAPHTLSNAEIMNFILAKQDWINTKIADRRSVAKKYSAIAMTTGDTLFYLGNTYRLEITNIQMVSIYKETMYVPNTSESKEILVKWLKEKALMLLRERAHYYAQIMGVQVACVKVTEAKTRWGSCSAKNNINFAWRLIMCPLSVIDYVVVHELSHIEYKNHGKQFWNRVKMILPEYLEAELWLKNNAGIINVI